MHIGTLTLGHYIRFFFLVSVLCGLLAHPTAGAAADTEWLLEQNHADLGKIDLYICHDAIKAVNRQWGYQLLAKAPTWTVHCFRTETKIEWTGALGEFTGSMLSNPVALPDKNKDRLGAFGKGTINGLKYTRYATSRQSLAAVYGADDIAIAAPVSELLCRYYNMPDTGKIPLYHSQDKGRGLHKPPEKKAIWLNMDYGKDLRGGLIVLLLTKSGKQIPFNPADFEVPHGYTMRRPSEVAYSNKQKATLTDVIDNMGFTSDSPASGKQLPAQKPRPKP
jgi:hypothetical protein